ncbi:MAG TPA: hypothetical protein VHG10_11280, partial [Glycomyces sp.]|nr:hypothetical protein [Glycomyces sp.]
MTAPATRRSTTEREDSTPQWRRALTSDTAARVTFYVASLLFWILLSVLFERVPGPLEVVAALAEEFRREEVFGNFTVTMYRFVAGVALATAVGILVGVLMGLSQLTRAFLESPV